MHQFSNILLSPLGEEENPAAFQRVADLASQNRAKLTLFGVAAEPSGIQRAIRGADHAGAIQEAEEGLLREKLARSTITTDDELVNVVVRSGRPALTIIEQVLVGGHDLVVVTTDEESEDRAAIRRLLRKCPCPVWVIRPSKEQTQRVLAAVNPDPEEFELNRSILEIAASVVRRDGGELHLVTAWHLHGESALRSSAFLKRPEAEVEALLASEWASRHDAVRDLLAASDLEDAPWQLHVVKGDPAQVVPEVIAKERINLLVMGTVARTGVPGLIIGNTAERVLDNVPCSVIATKPPGFISPVELAT